MAAGDRLIVLSDQGELSVVRANPAKFELLARFQVIGGKCWTTPCWRTADSMSETPRANCCAWTSGRRRSRR